MYKAILICLVVTAPMLGGAQNLVQNGDFAAGVNHWSYFTQRMDWVADDGVAGQGCMELGDTFNNGGTVSAYQEVPVAGDTTYLLRGWGRVPAGSAAQNVVVYVTWYDASGSRITDSQTFFGAAPQTGDWLELGGEVIGWANAASAEVKLGVALAPSGTDESVVRFDDVYFGLPAGAQDIFADGFESGDTTAWSSAVP